MLKSFIDTYATEIIGGLMVALLLLLVKQIPILINNYRLRRNYSGYVGDYFLYYYSTTGVGKIIEDSLSIKPFFGRLVVSTKSVGIYEYKGTINVTQSNVYITLAGRAHTEQIHFIFYNPLHGNIRKLRGVFSEISPISEPVAGYCLLSDKSIPLEFVKAELSKVDNFAESKILCVPRDINLHFDNIEDIDLEAHYAKKAREEE